MNTQLMAQYPIGLPTDYDMNIIRERVRSRGSALDHREGLHVKAYCVREAGVDDSLVNEYAPFYLWSDTQAAAEFLWHDQGFQGIVADFGRPRVHTWLPDTISFGAAPPEAVRHAVVHTWRIAPEVDLRESATTLRERTIDAARDDDVHLVASGIDPGNWSVVTLTTSAEPRPDAGTRYRVLHVSQPATPRRHVMNQ